MSFQFQNKIHLHMSFKFFNFIQLILNVSYLNQRMHFQKIKTQQMGFLNYVRSVILIMIVLRMGIIKKVQI